MPDFESGGKGKVLFQKLQVQANLEENENKGLEGGVLAQEEKTGKKFEDAMATQSSGANTRHRAIGNETGGENFTFYMHGEGGQRGEVLEECQRIIRRKAGPRNRTALVNTSTRWKNKQGGYPYSRTSGDMKGRKKREKGQGGGTGLKEQERRNQNKECVLLTLKKEADRLFKISYEKTEENLKDTRTREKITDRGIQRQR